MIHAAPIFGVEVVATAMFNYFTDESEPQSFNITAKAQTEAALQAIATLLRKNITPVHDGRQGGIAYYMVEVGGDLVPRKGNTRNETGIKRYRNTLKRLENAGHVVEWQTRFSNSYATRELFEAAIA